MFSVLSSAVTIYVFNRAVLKYIGELGVSALIIVFYIDSLVNISLYGLTMALQPIVSYNLGAKKIKNIYSVLKISLSKSILFVMVPLAILPIFLGNKGIWLATPTGEALCAILSIYLLMKSIDSLDEIE